MRKRPTLRRLIRRDRERRAAREALIRLMLLRYRKARGVGR